VALLWGPTSTGPCLSCPEGSRAGCRTPGGVSPERAEGQNSLPQPADHTSLDAAQDAAGRLLFFY